MLISRSKRFLASIALAIALGWGGATAVHAEDVDIMFVNPWPSHPFWAVGSAGANDAAAFLESKGVRFTETGTDEGYSNASSVLTIIETGIAQGYDAIIIHPFIPETFNATIDKAAEAGIHVIAVADDAPDSQRAMALSTDDVNAGRGAGQAMLDALGDATPRIAALSATPGVTQLENRLAGFREVIEAAGGEIATVEYGFSDVTQTLAKAQATLIAHPDINGFFGVGGDGAPAIIKVLAENDRDDITVIGFDDVPDTLQGVRDGTVAATIVQRQYLWGYGGVVYGYLLANGLDTPDFVDTGFLTVTAENIDGIELLTRDPSEFIALVEQME